MPSLLLPAACPASSDMRLFEWFCSQSTHQNMTTRSVFRPSPGFWQSDLQILSKEKKPPVVTLYVSLLSETYK